MGDSKSALIADVDCTADGKDLCEKHKIGGYPTIKHGDPEDLKDYDGGRDFAALKKFAEENLGPTCGPENLDLCDDENKALIEKLQKMEVAELDKTIEDAEAAITKLETKSQKTVDDLNKKISGLEKDKEAAEKKKDDTIAAENKKLGIGMARKVS